MPADAWELRTARLEGAYEQIDRRLGAVEGRLATLEQKMDTGFAHLRAEIRATHSELGGQIVGLRTEIVGLRSEMLSRMDRQFYWILGVLFVSGFLQLGFKITGH